MEVLLRAVEHLLLAGIVAAISMGVSQLRSICKELTDLKVSLAVIVEQVKNHESRLARVESKILKA
jgi:hypothetical protein